MQVGDTIPCFKTREDACIVDCIEIECVYYLEIHLKWSSYLVSPYFYPDFIMDINIVLGKCFKCCALFRILFILFQNSLNQVWDEYMFCNPELLPSTLEIKWKGGQFSIQIVSNLLLSYLLSLDSEELSDLCTHTYAQTHTHTHLKPNHPELIPRDSQICHSNPLVKYQLSAPHLTVALPWWVTAVLVER